MCIHMLKSSCDRQTESCLSSPHRSQRDTQGERERRLQQLKEHQEEMKNVDDRMKTAANDRQQFQHALTKSSEEIHDHL